LNLDDLAGQYSVRAIAAQRRVLLGTLLIESLAWCGGYSDTKFQPGPDNRYAKYAMAGGPRARQNALKAVAASARKNVAIELTACAR